MKTVVSKAIVSTMLTFSLLFIVGCGSENSPAEEHHSGAHMDDHASHGTMPHEETAGEDGHGPHDGDQHEDVAMMEQPEDARLVTITATDFEFSPAEIKAKPGEKLFIKLVNEGNAVHMWQLRDKPETHVHTPVGETSGKIVTAPEIPGEYEIFCSTPGHEKLGMVGILIVNGGDHSGHAHE